MKDKTLREQLFGNYRKMVKNPLKRRSIIWTYPANSEDEIERELHYPAADGLILYLVKRIEKLENKQNER